jgi:tetratricopeptide (TPR) repeat protein
MQIATSILWVLSIALGVCLGPQLRPWSWGPAMVALALSLVTALPALLRKRTSPTDLGMAALGFTVASWFAARAWVSPVPEAAQADLLLLAAAVGAFLCVRATEGNLQAEKILIGGIALILGSSIVVAGMQLMDPNFSPIFRAKLTELPTGFFAHYNEGANFIIGSTLIVAGAAVFGQHSRLTRIILGLIAIAGIVAVYYYRSRGGLLGMAVGSGVFVCVGIWAAKHQKNKWFAPALIALPILILGVAAFLFISWNQAQIARGHNLSAELLDNDIRLYLAGIAVSCINLHPWAGGGSRSYGWECYRFWESTSQGQGFAKPEFVHNELLQVFTDYGIIGGLILLLWIAATAVIIMIRTGRPEKVTSNSLAWQVGGVAGFAGVFGQSNFSFVFHMYPLVMMLGACLGFASRTAPSRTSLKASDLVSRLLLCSSAILCFIGLLPKGILGTRVCFIMLPSMLSHERANASLESRCRDLSSAIAIWPQSTFYVDRAQIHKELAYASDKIWTLSPYVTLAENDYASGLAMNPYDPSITINQALLFSALGKNAEAEEAFAKTINFQGGMENAFFGHVSFAEHLYNKASRQYRAGEFNEALATMEASADQIAKSASVIPWNRTDLRVEIPSSLGAAREAVNDYMGALAAYNHTCTIPGGHIAHFRAGVLLRKMGVEAWENRQPSEALAYFIEAKKRATTSGNIPKDFSNQDSLELRTYLDSKIKFLQDSKVTPSAVVFKKLHH